jgi:hypothetical protein
VTGHADLADRIECTIAHDGPACSRELTRRVCAGRATVLGALGTSRRFEHAGPAWEPLHGHESVGTGQDVGRLILECLAAIDAGLATIEQRLDLFLPGASRFGEDEAMASSFEVAAA